MDEFSVKNAKQASLNLSGAPRWITKYTSTKTFPLPKEVKRKLQKTVKTQM